MMLNNETMREAVKLWLEDKESAIAEYGHISDWDTSQVTNMSQLFKDADEFNEPLNDWDVSLVEDMSSMFEGASSFNQPLDNWDVSYVENFYYMFARATSFNQPLNMWDLRDDHVDIGMFEDADSFNKDWVWIDTPRFKKKIKILKCRHELHPYIKYTDIIFLQMEIDSEVESMMWQIHDRGFDGWVFFYGGEFTAKSDAEEWNEEMPEELKDLPGNLLWVFMGMDEDNIKSWPDSLIGMVVE